MAANPVREALHAKLAAHAPLTALVGTRIYFQDAPQDATYPLVIFFKSSGSRRLKTLSGPQARFDVWTVKGIATGSSSATASESIDEACEDALDGQTLTVAGRDTILKPMRDGDVEFAEIKDGAIYRHCGGTYQLITA